MLIGSENTCICVLVILYEVLIRGNHAGGGKGPLCSGASQFAAGYAAAQLSIDKRMSCTVSDDALSISFKKNVLCSTKYALRYANQPGFYVEPGFSP